MGQDLGARGLVAVWVGAFDDEDDLSSYLCWRYPEDDGDSTSDFLKDSGIGFYDEDFAEAELLCGRSLESVVSELSYGRSFASAVIADAETLHRVDAVLAIYDVDVAGVVRAADARMTLVGVYPYSTTGP